MSKRIAILLSGCGFYDGSEIQEAVFTLLALDQEGATWQCCAPDKTQFHVVDHAKGEPADEQRNILAESARIARGNIVPLAEIRAADYDAIILPGGYGAAKNLCSYATEGTDSTVDTEVARVMQDFHSAGKPIGAWCIAPILLAKVFENSKPPITLTIGNDAATSADIVTLGANHENAAVTSCVTDVANHIVTTPAYMYDEATPAQVFTGIQKAIKTLLALIPD